MALHRSRINMSLRLFIIPLLIAGFPYLPFAALAASKWLVEIKLRKTTISVYVRKLGMVGRDCRRMVSLLNEAQAQYPLSFAQFLLAGILTSLGVLAHSDFRRYGAGMGR